ncbi:hypothetical protein A0J61_09972 [Choanephora cucurbitarum]|uniref:RING-CH-type domain-containing protein n=1 Tax=Choanephora cucurbitarum TaxID=101091 RepID=A0A1C7N005_9FUNG|nr:hypothetical protein A0J61_09972 [Choanephora cucurbitarum]
MSFFVSCNISKYVHPHCMAGWRKALLQTGRESDLYHCQLCKHRLWVKQRYLWATLLHFKAFRAIIAALLLGLLLIPAGSIMKAFIHFSVFLTNYSGGITQAWTSNQFFELTTASILASLSPPETKPVSSSNFRALYSPFPVCFINSNQTDSHALFNSALLYYFLFPFADDRFWNFILCRLEHFHLGFFLLGSVNNIYFTYKVLNDMFDIVLLGQDSQQQEQEEQQQQQQTNISKRLSRLLKGFLLIYCCSLVVLFWIHFNIFAFHIDARFEYTSKQFVAELPLWTLRWITLGIAVGDFAARGIYRWLGGIANCVDQEDVLSLPEDT